LCILVFFVAQLSLSEAWAWNPFKEKEGVTITVAAPFIELRTGPGRGYPIVHVAEKGEQLRVYKRITDWYRVETSSGIDGWVKNTELNDNLAEDGSLAVFSIPAKEAYINRSWEFGIAGGEFSGSEALTGYVGYHLTQNISAELKYTQAFGDFSNLKLLTVNAVHQIWPEWRVSPFFTIGSGILQTSPSSGLVETVDREDSVLSVGGGFFIYASRNFLLRAEYNNHTALTSRNDNEEVDEWKAGFSVFF
jgi:uncharacterized protein YgiM (DUF1202 family)